MRKTAIAVAMLMLGGGEEAGAQDFMSVCRSTGSEQSCQCMQGKIPPELMPAAVAAMQKSNAAMSQGGNPLDPSTLPPDQMRGLQQVVLAQAACM
jgi:hypothetical protein